MFNLAILISTIGAIAASPLQLGDCKPNNTDFHCKPCMDNPELKFDPSKVTISPYPVVASKPIVVNFTFDNIGHEISRFKIKTSLKWYGTQLFTCGWHRIPLPPITLDGCKIATCPVPQGPNIFQSITVDMTPFASIISKLGAGGYYQLKLEFLDDNGGKELTCALADIQT